MENGIQKTLGSGRSALQDQQRRDWEVSPGNMGWFEMKQIDSQYQIYQQLIAECDSKINKIATQYTAMVDTPKAELLRSKKYNAQRNLIGFDIEKTAFDLWGLMLCECQE